MAVTVSYDFANIKSEFIPANPFQGPLAGISQPDVLALSDGGFSVAYHLFDSEFITNDPLSGNSIERYTGDGTPRPAPGGNPSTTLATLDFAVVNPPKTAQLAGGAILTAWHTPGTGIEYAIVDPAAGGVTTPRTLLQGSTQADLAPRPVALDNGGFAVAVRNGSGQNLDADLRIHNAAGALLFDLQIAGNPATSEDAPAVAALTGSSNIVVAYQAELADNTSTYGMAFQIFSEAGATVTGPVLFDGIGNQNLRPSVVALDDGGFAIAYEDNGWGGEGVTVWVFDAAGGSRGFLRADLGADQAFDDGGVTLCRLANGYLMVSWGANTDIYGAVIDPASVTRLGGPYLIENQAGSQGGPSAAGLANGTVVTAWTDFNNALEDGNTHGEGVHTSLQIDAFRRHHRGDGANDTITGDALIDVMFGGGGDDTLIGRGGADVLNGGPGSDTASYAGAAARVKISLDGSVVQEGDALGDQLISIARLTGSSFGDVLAGDGGGNVIRGGGGADTIKGQAGDDSIYGDAGADALTGGLGNDRFNYTALTHGGDTIKDFSNAAGNNDEIRFVGSVFGGLPAGALDASRFAANAAGAATTAAHRFIYETDTGILRFDANGSGAGGVTVIATLTGAPTLTNADIVII